MHFRNMPEYLESALPGLSVLSSGHACVRSDDGLCLLRDTYLPANACCPSFQRRAA